MISVRSRSYSWSGDWTNGYKNYLPSWRFGGRDKYGAASRSQEERKSEYVCKLKKTYMAWNKHQYSDIRSLSIL